MNARITVPECSEVGADAGVCGAFRTHRRIGEHRVGAAPARLHRPKGERRALRGIDGKANAAGGRLRRLVVCSTTLKAAA